MKNAWKAFTVGALTLFRASTAWPADPVTDYPSRPVTLLAGFPKCGPADMAARISAQRLHTEWPGLKLIERLGGTID